MRVAITVSFLKLCFSILNAKHAARSVCKMPLHFSLKHWPFPVISVAVEAHATEMPLFYFSFYFSFFSITFFFFSFFSEEVRDVQKVHTGTTTVFTNSHFTEHTK